MASATLIPDPRSSDHRQAALGGQRLQRVLHQPHDVGVDLLDVGVLPELLAQVDRRQRLTV